MFNLKMSKKMKKFFSLMLVALVMLGVTACEQNVTIDTPKSEGLSFYAEIAMTRADLKQGNDGKWATVWEGNETLYVNEFAFTNTESETSKFTCTAEGVAKLVGQDVTIKMENNSVPESGKGIMIEQSITAFDPTSTINLTAKNAFFRFTYTGDVTFTLSQPLFVVDGAEVETITVTADGDTWVSVLPGEDVTLSYSVNDIMCKETTLNIVAGKIFNLKELAGPEPSTLAYELVKDASQLSVGKYVIIAAADYSVAMSTEQKTNNRGEATITKYDNIAEVSETVQYILLEEGAIANTYAFNVGNGYLYAASSSANHLRTEATLSANSSWTITVDSSGIATIKAQGTNTRNVMQYNESSSLFSCYGSESQKALALYVGVDPSTVVKKTALETPVLNATLEGKIITLSWDYITNAKDYTVTFGNNEPMTVVGTTTTFDGEWNTSYEITVVANPVDDTKYIQSSATISVAIGSDPSSSDKVDILNRALTGVTGTSYTEWNDKTVSSKAVYAGQSAGGNESIQLRATSPSGIVTTASGGKATKVVVSWNSNTADGRTLDVYGKNTAYSKTTDLYSTSTQGTKIGSIVCGTSTELIIDGVYQYIGMRSNDGAMYIGEIQITWAEMTADDVVPAEPLAKPSDLKAEVTENTIKVSWAAVTGATGYKVSINDAANTTATIEGTSHIFTGLTADTEYTISVVALGNGETTTDSEVATIDAVPTAQDVSGDTTKTYTFSEYTAGTQYAENEEHKLDDVLTITTTDCHFTSELRIYSSSTYNGYAIGKLADGNVIKSLGFNAGYKVDTLNVYGSTDGTNWTLVSGVSITSTSYNDYTVDFVDNNYTYFKLDVEGANQIRIASLTLTYIPSAE